MDVRSKVSGLAVSSKVNRRESRAVTGSTVLRVEGESVLIAYDEGGEGWWPISSFEAATEPAREFADADAGGFVAQVDLAVL